MSSFGLKQWCVTLQRPPPEIFTLPNKVFDFSNIDIYKQAFGNNLVVINNDPEDVDKSFNPESIFKLYPQPKGKEKSPEEKAKSELEKEKLNQDIKSLLNIEREFDTFDEAKQKINQFINS